MYRRQLPTALLFFIYRSYVIRSAGKMGPPGSDTVWFTKSKQVLFVFGSTDRRKVSGCQAYYMNACLFLRTSYFVKTITLQLEVYNKAENIFFVKRELKYSSIAYVLKVSSL